MALVVGAGNTVPRTTEGTALMNAISISYFNDLLTLGQVEIGCIGFK